MGTDASQGFERSFRPLFIPACTSPIGALINKVKCLIDVSETTMLCSFQMLMQFGDDLPYGNQAIRQSPEGSM